MSSSLVFTESPNDGRFGAFISGFENVEAAQKDLNHAGGDEKVVAVVSLNEEDPGVSALAKPPSCRGIGVSPFIAFTNLR